MKKFRLASILVMNYLLQGSTFALESATTTPPNGVEIAHRHSLDQETAMIRQHHLSRLDDRLKTDPVVLHQTCKYESEISTAPPMKRVVLSFDDGPDPVQTEYILDVLKKYDISGTFFVIGEKAKAL